MKSFKTLSLLALSTLLVGCTGNNKNVNPPEPEIAPIDKAISEFLSDTEFKVPSLGGYNMEYDVLYYYEYGAYFITAECDDPTDTMENEYNQLITSDTKWIVYNDEDYTIEEYGHMYCDNFDNAGIEFDFYSDEGKFCVSLYRWDGEHGTLDVSNVDTSWYVDYVNFYGYKVADTFPADELLEEMGLQIIAPNASEFCYGYSPAYSDEDGYHAKEFIVLIGSDVSAAYASTLEANGFNLTETEDWTITEDWDFIEYTTYTGYDTGHDIYISFYAMSGVTMIEIFDFDDIFVDNLTNNTDWTDGEKSTMNTNLAEVLPFVQLGDGYAVGTGTYSGYTYVYVADNYYLDLTSSITQALLNNGFEAETDSSSDSTHYVKDNKTKYLEVYVGYQNGNTITAYYEATHYIPATAIALSAEAVDIVAGANYSLTATMTPANAQSTYEFSSDKEWCTVNEAGTVSIDMGAPVGQTATVTVTTSENKTDTCTFTVCEDKTTGVTLNATSIKLAPGQTFTLEVVETTPYGSTPTDVSWGKVEGGSDDISIDSNGVVTAADNATVGNTANVYYMFGSDSTKVEVTVTIVPATVTDTLDQTAFGLTDGATTYGEHTSSGLNGTYTAQCASTHGIQIRSKNSNSGIVGSCNGRSVRSVTVTFDSNTQANRVINVYGSTSEIAISNMYGSSAIAKSGTITYNGTDATVTFTFPEASNFTYVGLRSADGAIYITSIDIVWQ